jgi:hypothetical protein
MKSKARRINLRIANEEDGQLHTTTIDPCLDEIILVKTKDEDGKICETDKELEDDIEEVVNHEILHIIVKRLKNYLVSCSLDEISGWCKTENELRDKIIFLSKKDRKRLAKLVKEKKKPILKGIIEQLPD